MPVVKRNGISRPWTYVALAVAAAIALAWLAIAFGTSGQHLSTQTTFSKSSQTSTSALVTSISSSSSGRGSLLMSWGLTPMVLGPGTSIDYTIVFAGNLTGQFSLGFSAPKGISLNFTPSTVTLPSNQVVTDVRVQASDGLIPGDYAVVVIASGSAGSFSQTFQFRVVQRMIIIPQSGGSIIGFLPENLTVKVGSIVTWMSLDAGSDDTVGEHVVKFLTLNVTSPVLHLYDIWSHSFTQTGKFDYVDPINPQIAATVVVTD